MKDGVPIAAVDLNGMLLDMRRQSPGSVYEDWRRLCQAGLAPSRPFETGGADALALPPLPWCGSSGGGALFRPIGDGVVQGRAGRAPPRHDEIDFEMEAAWSCSTLR